MRDFDDNEYPLAYLITFRCYGTWLHGDGRGSYRRNHRLIEGVSRVAPSPSLNMAERRQLKHVPITLDAEQRAIVEEAMRNVCRHRGYRMCAINVRTNHVHTVVSARKDPESVLNAFQGYSTRGLRKRGRLSADVKPWARHGSTIYLWKERDVESAIDYVLNGQDGVFSVE